MSTPPIALAEPVPVGESYLLVRRLAMGGVADIFLARQTGTAGFEKEIVIKRLRPELRSNARVVKMFLEEARIGALLNHPNIVHVYDVDAADGAPYIAMEHIVGGELGAVCRRGLAQKSFLPFPHAVELMRQAAAGLGYLHAKRDASGQPLGLVHRDVSPSNMLVTEDGFLKLIDFGIAKSHRTDEVGERVLPGKLSYMAPEQVARRPVDPRADIFSLGVVMYEVTLGRRLFKGPAHEVAPRITKVEIEPPTFVRRNYPTALEQIVMKALAKDPAQRYQSAYDLADDLEEFLHTAKLASGPVRIARYLDELGHAEGRTRRPELSGRAGSEADAEQSELFSSFRAAPGREWDDAEEPIADVASALGIDVAELREMRVPASDLDASGDARQIRARRATGDLSRPLPMPVQLQAQAPAPKPAAMIVDEAATAREVVVTEVVTEVVTGLASAANLSSVSSSSSGGQGKKGKERRSDKAIKKGNKASSPKIETKAATVGGAKSDPKLEVAREVAVDSAEADTKPERKLDAKHVEQAEAKIVETKIVEEKIVEEKIAEAKALEPAAKVEANLDEKPEGKLEAKPDAKPEAKASIDTTEKVERAPAKLGDKRPDLASPATGSPGATSGAAFGAAFLDRAPPPHQRWVVIGIAAAVLLLILYLIAG